MHPPFKFFRFSSSLKSLNFRARSARLPKKMVFFGQKPSSPQVWQLSPGWMSPFRRAAPKKIVGYLARGFVTMPPVRETPPPSHSDATQRRPSPQPGTRDRAAHAQDKRNAMPQQTSKEKPRRAAPKMFGVKSLARVATHTSFRRRPRPPPRHARQSNNNTGQEQRHAPTEVEREAPARSAEIVWG